MHGLRRPRPPGPGPRPLPRVRARRKLRKRSHRAHVRGRSDAGRCWPTWGLEELANATRGHLRRAATTRRHRRDARPRAAGLAARRTHPRRRRQGEARARRAPARACRSWRRRHRGHARHRVRRWLRDSRHYARNTAKSSSDLPAASRVRRRMARTQRRSRAWSPAPSTVEEVLTGETRRAPRSARPCFAALPAAVRAPPTAKQASSSRTATTVRTYCIAFTGDGIDGDDLLTRRRPDFDAYGGGSGLAVCSIDDRGCKDAGSFTSCFCECQGGDCTYWAFFTQEYGNGWVLFIAWRSTCLRRGTVTSTAGSGARAGRTALPRPRT